jgi:TRAP-type mannitol/chloroaromatic compound transport system substrate-binding protein
MRLKYNHVTIMLVFVCIMSMLIVGIPTKASSEVINWKMQSFYPAAVKHGVIINDDFAALVKKMSQGRLQIKIFNAGEIVKGSEIMDAVGRGVVDCGLSVGAYWSGKIPLAIMEYGLPYSFKNQVEIESFVYDRGLMGLLREEYAKFGCHYVGLCIDNGFSILSKKPIRTVEDLKKMKLRATGATGLMLKELGASMVSLSGTELYTALTTGVIDGCVYGGFETQWKLGNHEVTKYIMWPKIMPVHGPNTFIVNKKKWDALSDDLKAIVNAAFRQQSSAFYRYKYNSDLEYFRKMQDYGLEVVTLSEAEQAKMQKAASVVWDRIQAKDESCGKAVKAMKDYVDFLGH